MSSEDDRELEEAKRALEAVNNLPPWVVRLLIFIFLLLMVLAIGLGWALWGPFH